MGYYFYTDLLSETDLKMLLMESSCILIMYPLRQGPALLSFTVGLTCNLEAIILNHLALNDRC